MTEPKTQFTPGPWHSLPSPYGKKYRYVQIGKEEGYTTAELLPEDAHLIAAAPDLYEALKIMYDTTIRMMSSFPNSGFDSKSPLGKCEAALAKARGER